MPKTGGIENGRRDQHWAGALGAHLHDVKQRIFPGVVLLLLEPPRHYPAEPLRLWALLSRCPAHGTQHALRRRWLLCWSLLPARGARTVAHTRRTLAVARARRALPSRLVSIPRLVGSQPRVQVHRASLRNLFENSDANLRPRALARARLGHQHVAAGVRGEAQVILALAELAPEAGPRDSAHGVGGLRSVSRLWRQKALPPRACGPRALALAEVGLEGGPGHGVLDSGKPPPRAPRGHRGRR